MDVRPNASIGHSRFNVVYLPRMGNGQSPNIINVPKPKFKDRLKFRLRRWYRVLMKYIHRL